MRAAKVLLAALYILAPAGARGASDAAGTPILRISAALNRGDISREAATLLSVRAILRPDLLPAEYRVENALPERCGTQIVREALAASRGLSRSAQAQIASDLVRPSLVNSFDSPGGFFRIHYNTSGGHAVPAGDLNANLVPDYVERIADYSDSSWRQEVQQYGYLPPPSDGGVGGNGAYDIYCQSIGAYGFASPESAGPEPWNDYTSYVVVHSTFAGFPPNSDPDGDVAGAAKATVAHEFMHACQFAYDVDENGNWMEMTATWMEDEVFDLVNDNYNYLPGFFNQPETPLFSVSPYGAFVWPRQIAEAYGAATIESIWDSCITASALLAIDKVLVGLGGSRDESFADFSVWNWITNSRDDGLHYEEAVSYPLMPVMRSHSTYPVLTQTSIEPPGAMGTNYVRFITSGLPAGKPLVITFDGEDGWVWAAQIVGENGGGVFEAVPFALDPNGAGEATLASASSYANVALVVSLQSVSGGANYEYSACAGSQPPLTVSPEDGDTTGSPVPLEWEAVPGALTYRVQVDDDSTFGSPEFDSVTTGIQTEVEGLPLGVQHYWRVSVTDVCGESGFGEVSSFLPQCAVLITGDVDVSGAVTSSDLIIMVNYIFKSGAEPQPQAEAGDVDCSGTLTSADLVKMVNYVFKSGAPPCNVCTII